MSGEKDEDDEVVEEGGTVEGEGKEEEGERGRRRVFEIFSVTPRLSSFLVLAAILLVGVAVVVAVGVVGEGRSPGNRTGMDGVEWENSEGRGDSSRDTALL